MAQIKHSFRRNLLLFSMLALSACNSGKDSGSNAAKPDGAPPLPQFQVRAQMPAGDRQHAPLGNGQQLFSHICGACHLPGGMGTNVLTGQQVAMGHKPEQGLLANRRDLNPAYVEAVVRNGKGAMPVLTRVDVSDAELKAIAGYLGKADK